MDKKQIYDLPELFEAVQLNALFEDCKTFVDCIPKFSLEEIDKKFHLERTQPGFDYKTFITENFTLPPVYAATYASDPSKPVDENIRALWDMLTREPSNEQSSLLNLPYTYVVPGGRFREIYYWDSYFTMLGLKEHRRTDLVESMIKNFAYLIRTYGHIPNGNRRYYLSRSQPPFFALMVTLLAEIRNDDQVFSIYLPELTAEYAFWMQDGEQTSPGKASSRCVRLPGGELLNRYFDSNPSPRQESFAEDVHLAKQSRQAAEDLYINLRAGAESGWDFSSRWFADGQNFDTIHTTELVPVDLNCLLFTLETTLARAMDIAGEGEDAIAFNTKAAERKDAIIKYCWNESAGFFCDYDFILQQQQAGITAAGLFPLFSGIASREQATAVAQKTRELLLKEGGIVTTTKHTGQQWDAPNGWAPLQWVAYLGLRNYGFTELATEIGQRWLSLNEKVFKETGKLMEKYNVEDLDKPAGGGEYVGQDGFGWTNGIYMALKTALRPESRESLN